jgi:hypothetical protein
LEALLLELLGDVSELKGLVAAQRDEIARLKGLTHQSIIKGTFRLSDPDALLEWRHEARRART